MTTPPSKSTLTFFGVEVTRRCNLKCPHCFTDSSGSSDAGVDTEKLSWLLEELTKVGATHVAFSGGEPLLRKDLPTIMRRGAAAGIKGYSLVTNGLAADAAKVTALRRAGLGAAQVSLDGVDAQDHCTIRQCPPIAFYRALRAIRLFQDAGIIVDIATILTPRNIARAPEMALLAEALKVRSLRYCTFVPTGRAVTEEIAKSFACEPSQLDDFFEFMRVVFETAKQKKKPGAVGMIIDHGIGPWKTDGSFKCDSGEAVVYITANGDLYPCPGLIFERFKVGNVYETPVKDLLESRALSRVRNISRDEIGSPCSDCSNPRCSGGCRGAAYAISGSEQAAPVYCNVLRRGGC